MIIVPTNTPRLVGVDPYWASTTALLAAEGVNGSTVVVDRSALNSNWTANGSLVVSTAQSKWGGSSFFFNGGGYLTPNAAASTFTLTGGFTIECWLRPSQIQGLMTDFRGGGTYFEIGINSGKFYFNTPGVNTFNHFSPTLSVNNWYHVAVARSYNTLRGFCNGVLGATVSNGSVITAGANRPIIGADGVDPAWSPSKLYGYMDDYRITAGVARYTGNFAPPEQLPTS